jgi:hypothetical protein
MKNPFTVGDAFGLCVGLFALGIFEMSYPYYILWFVVMGIVITLRNIIEGVKW